jgi:hypothetical protein
MTPVPNHLEPHFHGTLKFCTSDGEILMNAWPMADGHDSSERLPSNEQQITSTIERHKIEHGSVHVNQYGHQRFNGQLLPLVQNQCQLQS